MDIKDKAKEHFDSVGDVNGELIGGLSTHKRTNRIPVNPEDPPSIMLKVEVIKKMIKQGDKSERIDNEIKGLLKLAENQPSLVKKIIMTLETLTGYEVKVTDMFNDEQPRPLSEQQFDELLSDTDLSVEYKKMKSDKCGDATRLLNNAMKALNERKMILSELEEKITEANVKQYDKGINKMMEQIKISEDILRTLRVKTSSKQKEFFPALEDESHPFTWDPRNESGCPTGSWTSDNDPSLDNRVRKIATIDDRSIRERINDAFERMADPFDDQ